MNFEFCSQTDPGLLRDNNEDAVSFDTPHGLAILADGMGGYNAGEIASGMATAFIHSEMRRWLSEAGAAASSKMVRRALEVCVDNANRSIFNAATSNAQYSGMGTTLVVGVFQDKRLVLGHIGDSRCYRLRAHDLHRITRDHSLLQEQLDAGLITPQQAATSLNKNLVTRALGVELGAVLEVTEHRIEPGDLYLMCSDGLSDMVDDVEIAGILLESGELENKAKRLIEAANARGGRDNITVLLAYASAQQKRTGLISRLLGK